MPFLARKVEKGKWKPHQTLEVTHVPGDAITLCMRTHANTLSTWQIDLDAGGTIDEGILALVTGPNQLHMETIDVVLLDPQELEERELEVKPTNGKTLVGDLVETHRDIMDLTYAKLGTIAAMILKKIHAKEVIRRTKPEVTTLVIEALKAKRLEFDALHENVQLTIKERCLMCDEDIDGVVGGSEP